MKPRGVIFDLFGVVCEEIGRPWLNRSVPEPLRTQVHDDIFRRGDLGTIEEEAYWSALERASGQGAHSIRDEWYGNIREIPGMFLLVEKARARQSVALCSNAASWFFAAVEERVGISARFDRVIVSSEIGAAKPDARIYEVALGRMGLRSHEAVFVDDRPENVAAAESAGMRGILFTGAPSLGNELAALGAA